MNQIQQVVFGMNRGGRYSVNPITFPLTQVSVDACRVQITKLINELPSADNLKINASFPYNKPAPVELYAFTVGKSIDVVCPVTYALLSESSTIPVARSSI